MSSPRRNSLLIMEEGKRREENYGEQGERKAKIDPFLSCNS
jgi:hypothetical protein